MNAKDGQMNWFKLALVCSLQHVDPYPESVIETNPDAEAITCTLGEERRHGRIRGPLHGIPAYIKDVCDLACGPMHTACVDLLLISRPRIGCKEQLDHGHCWNP